MAELLPIEEELIKIISRTREIAMIGEDYERYCFQIIKTMRKMQNSYTRPSVTIKCQNESEQHV